MPSETQRIFIIELYWHLIHHGHHTFVSSTSHMSVPQMVVSVASEKLRCFRLPIGRGLKIMLSGFLRMAGLWVLEDMYFLITSWGDFLALEELYFSMPPPSQWTFKSPLQQLESIVDSYGCLGHASGIMHYAAPEKDGCTVVVGIHVRDPKKSGLLSITLV
jgi:hypothetical protein